MSTISDGTNTITPDAVMDYATAQESRNVVHSIIGRADPDYSLAPASLRSGTLNLMFSSGEDGEAARAMHADASVFTLDDEDVPSVSMRYVVKAGGSLNLTLDAETLTVWTLAVDYQEVR